MLRTIIAGVLILASTALASGQSTGLPQPNEHIDGVAALALAAAVSSTTAGDLESVDSFHIEHTASNVVVSSRGTRSLSSVASQVDVMDSSRLANVLRFSKGTPVEVTLSTDVPVSHATALAAALRFRDLYPDPNPVNLKDAYGAMVTLYRRDDGKIVVVLDAMGPPPPKGYFRIGCDDQEVYLVDANLTVTVGRKCHA